MAHTHLRRSLSIIGTTVIAASLIALPGAALADDVEPPVEFEQPVDEFAPDEVLVEGTPDDQQAAPRGVLVRGGAAISYTGTIVRLSHGDADPSDPVQILRVDGLGLLDVDLGDVSGIDFSRPVTVDVEVPASVAITGDAETDFAALSEVQDAGAVLSTLAARNATAREVAARGNVSPGVAAVH